MVNIKKIEKEYFYFNKPVPYDLKYGGTIKIYPILIEDWHLFNDCYSILTFNKMEIPIPEIIQMSYLQFLLEVLCGDKNDENESEERIANTNKLIELLKLCIHTKDKINFLKDEKNKPNIVLCDSKDNIKLIISPKDFDDIKKIILYQNLPNYDDTYISKDIRDVINETIKTKEGNFEQVTLEDKMAFLGNEIGLTNNDMAKMTYREFDIRYNMAVERMDYQINKTAEYVGNVKFNKKIEHLLRRTKKNKLDEFFVDADKLTNKINMVN